MTATTALASAEPSLFEGRDTMSLRVPAKDIFTIHTERAPAVAAWAPYTLDQHRRKRPTVEDQKHTRAARLHRLEEDNSILRMTLHESHQLLGKIVPLFGKLAARDPVLSKILGRPVAPAVSTAEASAPVPAALPATVMAPSSPVLNEGFRACADLLRQDSLLAGALRQDSFAGFRQDSLLGGFPAEFLLDGPTSAAQEALPLS
eukprot:m.221427 g.221427  ORF g.221427 m.221427 type:complete len:204 (+) comp10580_c0_seq1:170-781(+)